MPHSTTVRLAFALIGMLVVVMALILPSSIAAPDKLIRRLLFAWVLVSIVWPQYLAFYGIPGVGISPTRLIYWSLIAVWFFYLIGSRRFRAHLTARLMLVKPFVWLLSGYLIWNIVCALFAKDPIFSLDQVVRVMGGPTLIFLIALSCLRSRRDLEFVLLMVVLAALLSAGIGMLEVVKQKNLFFEVVPSLFPQGGVREETWAQGLINNKIRDGFYRVMSTFIHPLTFAEFMALSLSAAVFVAGAAGHLGKRLVGFCAVPLILAGVYVSHSRSASVALGVVVVGLVATLGIRAIRQRKSLPAAVSGIFSLVAVPIAAMALGAIAIELAAGRSAEETSSSLARLVMHQRGFELIFEQPILGYGPGMAAITIGLLPGLRSLTIDSYYLSVALETGLPGLLAFIGLLYYPTIKALALSWKLPGREGLLLAVLSVALIGFSVIKLALSLADNMSIAFLYMALIFIVAEQSKPFASEWSEGSRRSGGYLRV